MTVTMPRSINTSGRQRGCTGARRGPTQQTDLFGDERSSVLVDIPAWQDLAADTQAVLTRLMARLILDHVETRRAGSKVEVGHDL